MSGRHTYAVRAANACTQSFEPSKLLAEWKSSDDRTGNVSDNLGKDSLRDSACVIEASASPRASRQGLPCSLLSGDSLGR